MKRKIISLLIVFSLCVAYLNVNIVDVYASISNSTYTATIGSQTIPFADYPVGSYFTDNGSACNDHSSCGAGASLYNESACNCKCTYNGVALNSTSCYGFANMVFYRLFGHTTYSQTTKVVTNISASSINSTYLYNLFTNGTVKAGAHIRNSTHSMIFMGCDSSYIYTYEGNYDGHCQVGVIRRTWSEMVTYLQSKNGIAFIQMPNSYPTAPSTPTATLSIDRSSTNYNPGDVVTFTFGGNNSGTYTLGIYKWSEKIDTVTVVGNTYSRKFDEVAMYSAYMTAYNDYTYADSNWVAWQVNDLTANLSINKTEIPQKDSVTFTFGGNNSGTYANGDFTLGIYKDGVKTDVLTVKGTTYTKAFSEVGSYKAYMTAYSNGGFKDSNWVYWTVKPSSYIISYNANGGSGAPSAQTKTYGKTLTLSSTKPTRTGYTFKNWNTKADGSGTSYSAGGSYTANSAATLYAQWTANKYTVTLNNQSATTAGTASVSATYGSAMPSITVPKKTGYTFGGYYDETNGSGTQYYKADGTSARTWNKTSATTLYAKWTANTYKVTFNANGGTTPTASKNVIYASTYGALPKPTREGHTFDGWYTSVSGGTKITSSSRVSESSAHNLYAHWSKYSSADTLVPVSNMTYNGHYYLLFNDTTSWEFAEEYCKKLGGHLVTITNQDENDNIMSFVEKNNTDASKHYWLGATSSNDNEDVRWITGETFTYSNWAEGEPDKTGGQYWVNIYPKTGKWNDYINVYQTTGFICEFDLPYTSSTVTKSGTKLIIETQLHNFAAPYDILIVGYKNNKFVTMKRVPHNEQNSPYILEGDIDEVKVMVWNGLSTPKPLCNAEEIPNSKWKLE